MGDTDAEGWLQERRELLTRLAQESARAAELAQRLRDRDAVRAEPLVAREGGARLLARESERHQAELVRLQEAERVALEHAEVLTRQLRELRAELHTLQAQHATERMQAELELARAKAEAAGLQAAARRRAELARRTPEEREARLAQQVADEALRARAAAAAPDPQPAVDVPSPWAELVNLQAQDEPVQAPLEADKPRRSVFKRHRQL